MVSDALFRQDQEQAIFWYKKLLKNFGDHPGEWLGLAKLYDKMNHTTKATECLMTAKNKFPGNNDVHVALGELKLKEGKYEEALNVFRGIARKHPDSERAFFGILNALKAAGRMQEAIRHLESTSNTFLKRYEVNLEMGNIMVAMKDLDGAKSFYAQVGTPLERGQFVPVLLYRGLSDHSRSHNLWAHNFDSQLKGLADEGYTTVTVAEFKEILKQNLPLPVKPIIINFDGDSRDAFLLADPFLKKYGMKATLFVPTVRIYEASLRFAGWGKVRQYEESGRWDIQVRDRKNKEAGRANIVNARMVGTIDPAKIAIRDQLEFIEDRRGYNWVAPGATKPFLLRRFSVPGNWDGERLVQHFAETHPSHVAMLGLAKSHYWSGQVSNAQKIFSDLVAKEPRFKNRVQIYLADISYQGGKYLEAETILQNISHEESGPAPKAEKIQEAVAWKNRPRVSTGFEIFHDSNDRTNHSESARVYFPLKIPLELILEGALVNFKEEGRRNLDGNEVATGIN